MKEDIKPLFGSAPQINRGLLKFNLFLFKINYFMFSIVLIC
jgi:hypothetical protein